MAPSTVHVEPVEGHNALSMIWQENVTKADVKAAFKAIEARLQTTESPLFVIVDITANPNFPLLETINAALFGPYRHPRLKEWLIIGANRSAQMIERVLAGSVVRKNVRWFTNADEALVYLNETQNESL